MSLTVLFCLVACGALAVVYAQNLPQPTRQTQLLNGLKLLIWTEPKSTDITLKLRIHSGAAFDPKDKEGVMRLLADVMFPDEQSKLYFTEELGGNLTVEVNQDFIEITATGKEDKFVQLLDSVRSAVVSPPITNENVKKVRDARLKLLQEQGSDTAQIADAAVRKRLFGEFFPYGRPADGTLQSVAKIDRADLLLAQERFLTADNATLAIVGNVDAVYTLRAVKQFFGGWNRADKPVPPTFRQPDAPDVKPSIIKLPSVETGQIRFAVRGAARNSADFAAAEIVANILHERWRNALPNEMKQNAFVRHEPHVLPGIVIFGASINGGFAEPVMDLTQKTLAKVLGEPIAANEFERARSAVSTSLASGNKTTADAAEMWLDADTFKLSANTKINDAVSAATLTQAQTVAANLQKQTPVAVAVSQGETNAPAN